MRSSSFRAVHRRMLATRYERLMSYGRFKEQAVN
jgi:hypothetical protein